MIAAITTAVCAVVMVVFVITRSGGTSEPDPFPRQSNWRDIAVNRLTDGQTNASVRIVEFADFECPACKSLTATLATIRSKYPKHTAFEFRHFPLSNHPSAVPAAIAVECAARQGKFRAMHDTLYARQSRLLDAPWVTWAQDAGVSDTVEFRRCLTDPAIAGIVSSDQQAATELSIRGTPTLFINDIRVSGAFPERIIDSLIRVALDEDKRRGIQ